MKKLSVLMLFGSLVVAQGSTARAGGAAKPAPQPAKQAAATAAPFSDNIVHIFDPRHNGAGFIATGNGQSISENANRVCKFLQHGEAKNWSETGPIGSDNWSDWTIEKDGKLNLTEVRSYAHYSGGFLGIGETLDGERADYTVFSAVSCKEHADKPYVLSIVDGTEFKPGELVMQNGFNKVVGPIYEVKDAQLTLHKTIARGCNGRPCYELIVLPVSGFSAPITSYRGITVGKDAIRYDGERMTVRMVFTNGKIEGIHDTVSGPKAEVWSSEDMASEVECFGKICKGTPKVTRLDGSVDGPILKVYENGMGYVRHSLPADECERKKAGKNCFTIDFVSDVRLLRLPAAGPKADLERTDFNSAVAQLDSKLEPAVGTEEDATRKRAESENAASKAKSDTRTAKTSI